MGDLLPWRRCKKPLKNQILELISDIRYRAQQSAARRPQPQRHLMVFRRHRHQQAARALAHRRQARACALQLRLKFFLRARQVVFTNESAIGDRRHDIFAQIIHTGDAAQLNRRLLKATQVFFELFHLLFERETHQARHAQAHGLVRRLLYVKQAYRHTLALIHQRRVAGQLAALARERNLRGQITAIPHFDVVALDAGFVFTNVAEGQLRCLPQLRLQRRQIAPAGHFTPGIVDHPENHFQMRGNLRAVPHIRRHRLPRALPHKLGQRIGERLCGIALGQKRRHLLRQREQIAPQVFRQCLEIRAHFVADHARCQPIERRFLQRVEQMQRHRHGDAIQRMAGFKAVAQLVRGIAHLQRFGILRLGNIRCRVAHQILAREKQQTRIGLFSLDAPRLKRRAVVDVVWHALVVKREQRLLIHQHVALARLVFQRLHLFDNDLILNEEFRSRLKIPFHQRAPDKNLARLKRINRPVMHAALGHDGEAIQRHALKGRDHAAIFFPMRIKVMPLHHAARDALNPVRVKLCDTARIKTRRFDQFGGHHPFRLRLAQYRAGEYRELDATRAEVFALVVLETQVAEQAREQRAVYLLKRGGNLILAQAHFCGERGKLAVDIAPFAHAALR